MFHPIKVIDIELSRPFKDITGLDGYIGVQGLGCERSDRIA